MDPDEQEEQQARRPRVVDKRVASRPPEEREKDTPASRAESEAGQAGTPPEGETGARGETDAGAAPDAGAGERVWTPEEEAAAQRAAQEMAAVPARDWVLNVAVTLANVAGVKLQDGNLDDARLAIDAFSGMVDAVESQMGDAGRVLRQTLAQLQMAYAQASGGSPGPAPP